MYVIAIMLIIVCSVGSQVVYELDYKKPVLYVIPIQSILGKLPVVPVGDSDTIPYHLRNTFSGAPVGRVEDLLGRVPLIPCFLDGNAISTIPHKYSSRQKDAFECRWCWPNLDEGQPCLRDQHQVVELWTAPA